MVDSREEAVIVSRLLLRATALLSVWPNRILLLLVQLPFSLTLLLRVDAPPMLHIFCVPLGKLRRRHGRQCPLRSVQHLRVVFGLASAPREIRRPTLAAMPLSGHC